MGAQCTHAHFIGEIMLLLAAIMFVCGFVLGKLDARRTTDTGLNVNSTERKQMWIREGR